jgi:hypothetical protein
MSVIDVIAQNGITVVAPAAKQLFYIASPGQAAVAAGSTLRGALQDVATLSAFTNSWVNFGGGGPTYEFAAYWLNSFGEVCLQGSIKAGTMSASAFTLPAGLRPAKNHQYAVASYNGTSNIYGMVEVTAAGLVVPTVGANNLISLDGIRFTI